jgi:hypothetical protein
MASSCAIWSGSQGIQRPKNLRVMGAGVKLTIDNRTSRGAKDAGSESAANNKYPQLPANTLKYPHQTTLSMKPGSD